MAILILVLAPFALLFIISGIVLIWVSATGKYTDKTCSCGYDLGRLPKTSTRCPECGLPRRHVTIASPRLLTVGLILLIAPFAVALLVVLTLAGGALFF